MGATYATKMFGMAWRNFFVEILAVITAVFVSISIKCIAFCWRKGERKGPSCV